jgi:quercetin dioxygenase-like cupin family protein
MVLRTSRALWICCVILSGRVSGQTIQCIADSLERRGEPGCSVIDIRSLHDRKSDKVYWHIDVFESLEDAQRAAGPSGVAFSAHGQVWVAAVDADSAGHRAAGHRTVVGPISLQPGRAYMMQTMSAYFLPGQRTRVHTHAGPEAWYVIAGEQCLETPRRLIRARAGQGAIVEAGDTMRLVATGDVPRRSLVLILYDAGRVPMQIIEPAPVLKVCT